MQAPLPCLERPQPADAGAVQALLTRVYAEYGQVLEPDTLDADLGDLAGSYPPPSAFRVLRVDGEVVGTVACRVVPTAGGPPRADLKRLFLDERRRGRGEGRALCLWAAAHARAAGATQLDIWTDVLFEDAHRLYARLGAVDTGERRHLGGRNRIDERHFRLALSPPDGPSDPQE